MEVLEKEELVSRDFTWDNRIYKATKFPVEMLNGKIGVGAYIEDVTTKQALQEKQERLVQRNKILVDVLSRTFKTRREQLDYVLDKSLSLTGSKLGYIFLYNDEEQQFTLEAWSKDVLAHCKAHNQQTTYRLAETGIWGEVVRQRKPIILNDFQKPNTLKKGYPAGHVQLYRFMSIPVIIDEKIVAAVGLANKDDDYDENDLYEMTALMHGVWNAVQRKETLDELAYERSKYLQTLISIGDGVLVVNNQGHVRMLNRVAQELTGWTINEAAGRHYRDVFKLSDETATLQINDPIADVFKTNSIQQSADHSALISKGGAKYFIEITAAPIRDDKGTTSGVVLVFRDITEKEEQKERIEYLTFHDPVTGLFNRSFFEEELRRLDTDRNLPISIIVGDVNGLKLTNDIFGHSLGDQLLQRVAEVLRQVCRSSDIISRWGGDEFVILLPKTTLIEAEQIKSRITNKFANERLKAVKVSISMGCDTKQNSSDDIMQILKSAEEKMYWAKTLERDGFQKNAIDTIIQTLHDNSTREKEHAERVSKLCKKLGRALHLPEVDIHRLKEAGSLHDIGKIVLEPELLNKHHQLIVKEQHEMKKHPLVGFRILNSFEDTMDLAEAVLAHHEWWDGTGYPKGLKGDEIPQLAMIIAIAETYDRITHDSANAVAISKTQALEIIREQAGKKFEPQIAEAFITMMKD